ncbi:hypothetical protein BH20VER2_BH20VER2_12240 [soil metagenome]
MLVRQRPTWRRVRIVCCVALACVQLVLLLSVSLRDTLWLLANSRTILPTWQLQFTPRLPEPLRKLALVYAHCAGIERGYGFFAPNVPAGYDLAFEIEFPDGSVEHVAPEFQSREERVRWASGMDYLGRTDSEFVREVLLKLLAHSMRQHHPGAEKMRVTLSQVRTPTIAEFQAGRRPVQQALYTYHFRFIDTPPSRGDH